MATHRGKVAVYDLVNAGPRHRFTVSGRLVHNCLALGYNGGVNSLRAMGAEGNDIELQYLVRQWREANSNIVQLWRDLEAAFRRGGAAGEHLEVEIIDHDRLLWLPSGRAICYRKVGQRWAKKPWSDTPQKEITFSDPKKDGNRVATYGGKLTENVTQAIARDILVEALLNLQNAGYAAVGHVHDEILVESPSPDQLDDITRLMTTNPDWATGLPLDAEGGWVRRYQKV